MNVFEKQIAIDINKARMEHLLGLKLDFKNKSLLELGCGIGKLTKYLIYTGAKNIMSVDARQENIDNFQTHAENISTINLNLENKDDLEKLDKYDIIFCYGTLYHVAQPELLIEYMSKNMKNFIIIETMLTNNWKYSINLEREESKCINQSFSGIGCRPTKRWIVDTLKRYFKYVYVPLDNPKHKEFYKDFFQNKNSNKIKRGIFICSNKIIKNDNLILI